MKIDGRELLICDCQGTMPLDGTAIAKACGATSVEMATELCGAQIDRFERALKRDAPMIVACTQEAPRFEEIRIDAGVETAIGYVNIRERAGWSAQARAATPKIAALLAEAALTPPVVPAVELRSEGVTLIYGRDAVAVEAATKLADRLNVTVLLRGSEGLQPPRRMEFPIVAGRINRAKGYLGAFELVVDGYATPTPSSRDKLIFGAPRNGAASKCDLILDLTGEPPLFPAHEKRDGYLRADPGDPIAVADLIWRAADLTGGFEKPRYINARPDICAHSRSAKIGCSRCVSVCPTGAITPGKDAVAIDPQICAGCGACAAVCPTGSADFAPAPSAFLLDRLRALLTRYHDAGGRNPILLVHDEAHGEPILDALARYGDGLPAHVIPFQAVGASALGIEFFAGAFAYGASEVRLLTRGQRGGDLGGLPHQIGVMEALLGGLGYGSGRIGLIETDDPDALSAALTGVSGRTGANPARFAPVGDKRPLAKLALAHLHAQAPTPVDQIILPQGAIFGSVTVNAEGCTLCLSCVAACPTGALSDDPDRPFLGFTEDACVQCGLCQQTCPEKVVTLAPRFDFTNAAKQRREIKSEEPFCCIRCAKPFGVKSTIEKVLTKLGGVHWMYADNAAIDRMRMCADCRVIAQSESKLDPYSGPPRPPVQTTEDFRRELERRAEEGTLDDK
jgi:ferredoxin